jgi:hypothetical protein
MIKKYRKSFFGATAIVVGVAAFVFVIAIVVTFFFAFKYQIRFVIQDQYLWNKFQEVPLNLFSMSIDGESFVCRMNKIYHKLGDDSQLKEELDKTITKQLFYFFEGTGYSYRATIYITGMEITKSFEGCSVTSTFIPGFGEAPNVFVCKCSSKCALPEGYEVGQFTDIDECYTLIESCTLSEKKVYSAKYPFPISFKGNGELVDELSYNIIEVD